MPSKGLVSEDEVALMGMSVGGLDDSISTGIKISQGLGSDSFGKDLEWSSNEEYSDCTAEYEGGGGNSDWHDIEGCVF